MIDMLITPIVNLCGDRAEILIDRYRKAYKTLWAAKEALYEAMPNVRNYQRNPYPYGDYEASRDQMCFFLGQIDLMLIEFDDLALEIEKQRRERSR